MENFSFETLKAWLTANWWRTIVVFVVLYVLIRKFVFKPKGVKAKKPILI